jgi:hypothetical protein
MRPKPIYQASSLFELVWTIFLRLACIFALFYAVAHFEENPIVISVFAGLCLIPIFILGDDYVSIYTDKVVYSTNSLASLIFKSGDKVYKISDIKRAYLNPDEKPPNVFEKGVIMALLAITPGRNRINESKPIFFETKSGTELRMNVHLGQKQMEKIVKTVNSLIK